MKKKCPLCGFENEEGSKFCKNCNEPLFKQGYSEDNSYIKMGENEDQPFEHISDEEDDEEKKIEIIPHWKWLLQEFLKKDLKGWVIIFGGFIVFSFLSKSLAIGICAQLNIKNVKFLEGLCWFIFIIILLVIENVLSKKHK